MKAHRKAIEAYLAEELRLRLKPGATFINSAANGLTFLGRRIFPKLVRLAPANLRRITHRMDQGKRI